MAAGVHNLVESGFQWTDRQDFFVAPDDLVEDFTDVAPFLSYTQQLTGEEDMVDNPIYKLFEHQVPWLKQQLLVNDAAPTAWPSSGDPGAQVEVDVDTLTGLDSGGSLGDYLLGWEGEIYANSAGAYSTFKGTFVIVDVDPTAGSVTIEANGNPADPTNNRNTNLADNDFLYLIGKGRATGTTAGEAFSDEVTDVWNSCEYQEFPVEVDGDLLKTYLRGTGNSAGSEIQRLNEQGRKNFAINRNRKMLFGVRRGGTGMKAGDSMASGLTDKEGRKFRKTMGTVPIIRRYGSSTGDTQNIWTFDSSNPGTSTTLGGWFAFSEKVSQYQPGTYPRFVAFGGRGALTKISTIFNDPDFAGTGQFMIEGKTEQSQTFRFNVRLVGLPHCEFEFVTDDSFRGPYHNSMVITNPDAVGIKRFEAEMFKQNIKIEDDYHGQKNVYTVDEGLWLVLQKTHHYVTFT